MLAQQCVNHTNNFINIVTENKWKLPIFAVSEQTNDLGLKSGISQKKYIINQLKSKL